jgi:hypothetical protein
LLGALMDWLGWRNIKVVHLLSMNQATLSTSLIPTFVSSTLQMELGMHVKNPGREGHTVYDFFIRDLALFKRLRYQS